MVHGECFTVNGYLQSNAVKPSVGGMINGLGFGVNGSLFAVHG